MKLSRRQVVWAVLLMVSTCGAVTFITWAGTRKTDPGWDVRGSVGFAWLLASILGLAVWWRG